MSSYKKHEDALQVMKEFKDFIYNEGNFDSDIKGLKKFVIDYKNAKKSGNKKLAGEILTNIKNIQQTKPISDKQIGLWKVLKNMLKKK